VLEHAGQQHIVASVRRRLDQILSQLKFNAREFREVFHRQLWITGRGGHRGADGGGAEVDCLQDLTDRGNQTDFLTDRRAPAIELLTE